jgi:hypothetical protein
MNPLRDGAPCVLVHGLDPVLLQTRAMVIETAGFLTYKARCIQELSEGLGRAACRAVVLCHTLSASEAEFASALAKDRTPGIKVIAIEHPPSAIRAAFYDELLATYEPPESLLSVLEHAIWYDSEALLPRVW